MTGWWAAQQLALLAEQRAKPVLERFNPRPLGVIQKGSTTDEILQFLTKNKDRFFTCEQLMKASGRTHSAVSFSLIYLREQKLVETVQDEQRNSRYLRYRAKK